MKAGWGSDEYLANWNLYVSYIAAQWRKQHKYFMSLKLQVGDDTQSMQSWASEGPL